MTGPVPTPPLAVVGGSWGGLEAARSLVAALPADLGGSVVVVLHRSPRGAVDGVEGVLARDSPLPVTGAEDKQPLEPGHVYVAPPDYHLLVDGRSLALSTDPPQRFSRPSIDVLFESAAHGYPGSLVGVLLSGANTDGAAGLAAIARGGGVALAQDPATAARGEMPAAAIATSVVEMVAAPRALGEHVARLFEKELR